MKGVTAFGIIFIIRFFTSQAQDCWCGNDLQNTLRPLQKLLSAHETSFQRSIRRVRKKLSLLQDNTVKRNQYDTVKNSTGCPHPEPLVNGRILGRVFKVGHEIHFLCRSGFQLMGSETRLCLGTQIWSGEQPSCKFTDRPEYKNASAASSGSSSSSSSQSFTSSRPPRCVEFLGSAHCSCEQGYSISSRDIELCTDIDECELFRRTQPGRLCLHTCVNTAGGFFCRCPSGYSLARDNRSCHDIDECVKGAHNCSREQVCVNTHGGHRCMEVECPRFNNATYIKTSALRCDRNPCLQEDKVCLQAPLSVNFHFMSLVSNMSTPAVLFRLSAARVHGDSLRFGLLGNRGVQHFTIQRSGRLTGQLVLVNSVLGPATLRADIEMSELEKNVLLGRYITKVTVFVSPYNF